MFEGLDETEESEKTNDEGSSNAASGEPGWAPHGTKTVSVNSSCGGNMFN